MMLVVAKPYKLFNTLAAAFLSVGLAIAGPAQAEAAPGEDVPVREAPSPEPVLAFQAPDGYCLFDAAEAAKPGRSTGFEPGLRAGTELMVLYVPCATLAAVQAGDAEWLPEWMAIEKNIVTYPSDDERNPGAQGAVKRLCQDAQSAKWGHPRYESTDFAALVLEAGAKLSIEQPEIFLGVIGEEDHACYLSSLRIVFSPSGQPLRFLVVTAFMQAGDRWVTQSMRRQLAVTREGAEAILASAKKESKSFADRNR